MSDVDPALIGAPLSLLAAGWCARHGVAARRAALARRRLDPVTARVAARGLPAAVGPGGGEGRLGGGGFARPGEVRLTRPGGGGRRPGPGVAAAWRAAVPRGAGMPVRRWRVLAVVAPLAGGLVGGGFGLVVATATVAALGVARWAHGLGAGARYDRSLVDAVDDLARQLRSGANVATALPVLAASASGALRADLDRLVARVEAGVTLECALQAWLEQRPRPAVRLVAGAIAVGVASGGLRARVVDELAGSVRGYDRARREAAALAGQAQLSAMVMTATPLAFAAVLAVGDAAARAFLVRSPAGLACLAVGLALDLGAAAWMVRLTAGPAWLR